MTQLYIPEVYRDERDYFTQFYNGNHARGIKLDVFSSDFSTSFTLFPQNRRELPLWAKKLEGSHSHLMYHAYITQADREYQKGNYRISDYYFWEANNQLKGV